MFGGRHIGFSTSGMVVQYSDYAHSDFGPRKCLVVLLKFRFIPSGKGDKYTSG
jgi:hypothetical protein